MRSMLAVLQVLRMNGRFSSTADRARTSGAPGQISPCRPIGATPKGASYTRPKSSALSDVSPFGRRYTGRNSTSRISSVFFRRLTCSLQPPSRNSKMNRGTRRRARARRSSVDG